jgi:hypothetical protein
MVLFKKNKNGCKGRFCAFNAMFIFFGAAAVKTDWNFLRRIGPSSIPNRAKILGDRRRFLSSHMLANIAIRSIDAIFKTAYTRTATCKNADVLMLFWRFLS